MIAGIVPFNWPPIHTAGQARPGTGRRQRHRAQATGADALGGVAHGRTDPVGPARDRVVQAVPGRGAVGAALAGHRLVGKVSFTGSPRTGAAVLRTAAGNLTPTLMELGGKNPLVVFDDADLHEALLAAVDGGFFNQGEACTAASRILVQDSIFAEFEAKLCRRGEPAAGGRRRRPRHRRRAVGHPRAAETGPGLPRIGVAEGARIAAQAPLPDDPRLADGFYVAPTVLTDVTPAMRVATRGDLRPGRHPDSVHRRGRGGADRQRHAVRTWSRRCSPRTAIGRCG